jgi:hypothetical protein
MEKDVVNQTGPEAAWKVLSPIGNFWLAFLVATGGLGIRLVLPDAELVKTGFLMWCLQAGVIFPLSALVSSFLVYMLYEKSFGHAKPGKLKWLAFVFLAYFLISVLAIPAVATVGASIKQMAALDILFGAYVGMIVQAPWEFGIYAVFFFFLNVYAPFEVLKTSFPVRLNIRPMALPVFVMVIMAGIALTSNVKPKHEIQEEFMNEIHRVGEFLPATDKISIGNAIKAHENKYDLKVTGEVSDELLQKLREEPTKLVFTVGDKDAEYDKLGSLCSELSSYRWRDIRKQMKLREDELIRFEIKIKTSYTVTETERCSPDKNINLTISPLEEGAPASIHFKKTGSLELSSDESFGLEVKGLKFEGDGSSQMIEINKNVVFKENTLIMPKVTEWFGLRIAPSNENVRIEGNKFIHSAVLIAGSADVVGNHFSGESTYVSVKEDGAPEIGTNYFEMVTGVLVSAAGKSRPKVTGKFYLSTPSKKPLLYATDNAVIDFKDGSIAGPNAAGCLYAEKAAKLVVNNVNIGPCGENYWPVYLGDKATAEIRGSVFSTRRGELKNQFNKQLEDAVLVLENNKVAE